MDSDLSIDAIVTALHLSLEETLKVSLGPFVDKFNSSREQFNVVSDLLKQLPEYKEIIKHNDMLMKENRVLKQYIQKHCRDNNRIKLKINEIDNTSDDEESMYSLDNHTGDNITDIASVEEAVVEEEEEEEEEEVVEEAVVEEVVEEEEEAVVEEEVEEEEVDVEEEEEEEEEDKEDEDVSMSSHPFLPDV